MTAVLYRKHRPQNFDAVSNQEHVTQTLKNSLVKKRLAHAYLFTGPRGVGKTSVARILAKASNCLNLTQSGEPCDVCEICNTFNDGKSLDMIEIDAASNRGIDEIRDLREKVKFAPSKGNYKIFIIDEVHMLTKEAFNALLKTLEEPPPHAIFILATTEIHKVPDTIISRCQRFDFSKMDADSVATQLKKIAKAEKISIDEEALAIIASESEGSLRDAISTLDQVASFSGNKIGSKDVSFVVGRTDSEKVSALALLLVKGKIKESLDALNDLLGKGGDLNHLQKNLLEFFREVLLFKACKKESKKYPKEKIEKVSNASEEKEIIYILDLIYKASKSAGSFGIPQLPLEVSFIKIGYLINGTGQESKKEKNKEKHDNQSTQGADISADKWDEILLEVKSASPSVHAFLKAAEPDFSKSQVSLKFAYQFHKERIEDRRNLEVLEKAIKKATGNSYKVKCELARGAKKEVLEPKKTSIIEESIDIFGGEVIG
jgi:DNA polymerase III subunit gamma/tau